MLIGVVTWVARKNNTVSNTPPPMNDSFMENFSGQEAEGDENVGTDTVKEGVLPDRKTDKPIAPLSTEKEMQQNLETLAKTVAERWGSYSNQQQVSNIASLMPLMTDTMRPYAIEEAQKQTAGASDNPIVRIVVTKALSVSGYTIQQEAGTVQMTVLTQRQEKIGAGNERKYYQNLEIGLIKVGETWMIESIRWGEEVNKPE